MSSSTIYKCDACEKAGTWEELCAQKSSWREVDSKAISGSMRGPSDVDAHACSRACAAALLRRAAQALDPVKS